MRLPITLLAVGIVWTLGSVVVLAAPPPPPPPLDTGDTGDTGPQDTGAGPDDTGETGDTSDTGPQDTDTDTDTGITDTADTAIYVGAAGLAGETGGCGCASVPASSAFGAGFWLLGLAVARRGRRG
jgi:hypothetical protein